MDIYRDAKLFTDPEGDSCFSIYQIRWIKSAASLMATISSSETFAKRRAIFLSVRKTVNTQGYSDLRELLTTHLVNTKYIYLLNSQPRIMHFAYSDWFTQSWLSAHIP